MTPSCPCTQDVVKGDKLLHVSLHLTLTPPSSPHACMMHVVKGDELLQVPLRLAHTDYPDDEDSNRLCYEV